MRISDSDYLVDGWQFASGVQETALLENDGICWPMDAHATQWAQGCAAMANHDSGPAMNATLSFVPLARDEAHLLLPRIPTLRAHRHIKKGEEILFNYGSSLPFMQHDERPAEEEESEAEEEEECGEELALSSKWKDLEWMAQGVDASALRAVLGELRERAAARGASLPGTPRASKLPVDEAELAPLESACRLLLRFDGTAVDDKIAEVARKMQPEVARPRTAVVARVRAAPPPRPLCLARAVGFSRGAAFLCASF